MAFLIFPDVFWSFPDPLFGFPEPLGGSGSLWEAPGASQRLREALNQGLGLGIGVLDWDSEATSTFGGYPDMSEGYPDMSEGYLDMLGGLP